MTSRRDLQAEIDREERRLADLEAKVEEARAHLATLIGCHARLKWAAGVYPKS